MNNEVIALAANLALTLSFIVGLIFGIAQVKAAGRDRKERFTLETLRTFQSHEFAVLAYDINASEFPPTMKEFRKLPSKDQIIMIQFTQMMESLGILVGEKLINIELVDKTLGSFVITSWEKLKTLILDIRENQPDPFLSEYFQWLAEQLNERMKNNPRKPFFETANVNSA